MHCWRRFRVKFNRKTNSMGCVFLFLDFSLNMKWNLFYTCSLVEQPRSSSGNVLKRHETRLKLLIFDLYFCFKTITAQWLYLVTYDIGEMNERSLAKETRDSPRCFFSFSFSIDYELRFCPLQCLSHRHQMLSHAIFDRENSWLLSLNPLVINRSIDYQVSEEKN